jgi:hypothetical protein
VTRSPQRVALILLFIVGAAYGGITLAPGPEVSSSPVPAVAGAPQAPFNKAALQREFERAQAKAMSSLLSKQKRETDAMKVAQKARRKEWIEKEKTARHAFLAEKHKGPEIRVYMRDYQSRLKELDRSLAEERALRLKENEARFDEEKRTQASRRKDFQDALSRGERPSQDLWPTVQ